MMNVDIETRGLLDKLYNLRSKESVILSRMEDEKDIAEQTKNRTADEKLDLTEKIKELSDEEVLLAKEGELLKGALKNINKASFAIVFNKLNIDFDPKMLSEKVESVLPSTIAEIKEEILTSNENLENIVKEMNDAITKIEELAIRKDEALNNQSKLNEYVDLALGGNINITRDALTNLLSKFDLSNEEQRECAKLLMFPEDGLYEYDENVNKKTGKTFSDVFAEAKQNDEIKAIKLVPKEQVIESENEVKPIKLGFEKKEEKLEPIALKPSVSVSDIEPFSATTGKVDIKSVMEEKGFNLDDFSDSNIKYIKDNFDKEVFEINIKKVIELGLNSDIFVENVELFTDKDLEEKLNTLIGVGKVPFDIYLNPNILVKYDIEELKKSIDVLIEKGLDPKKVPLMAF